ncbi:MAG: PepSY domain-containing protein [Acidobacteria bacterium]|nr:PepSY domain-containing protein [Acidobacteriota bacterium]
MKRAIQALMYVHRYLGVAFCLIFIIWFASGIVMVFKRMPEYSMQERLSRLPPLNAAAIRLTPSEALEAAGLGDAPRRVFLTSLNARPVYRFVVDRGSATVSAETGDYVDTVDAQAAVAIAAGAFPESRQSARYRGALDEPDQWTIGNPFRVTGALHRIALGDVAGTDVYVAEATGDIVMKTDRSSRLWGYAGPVMHWFYFTPLRAGRGPLWSDLIIYGSVVGCLVCLLGLIVGVYRFSVTGRYRRGTSITPYVGWMRWHHYAGLAFGVFAFTWVFSGLLTMSPWNLFPQGGPTLAQIQAIRGEGVLLDRFTVAPSAALVELQRRYQPREVELLQFMGAPFYAIDVPARAPDDPSPNSAAEMTPAAGLSRVLVSADTPAPRVKDGFSLEELVAAARAAMGGAPTLDVTWLTDGDAYYYQRGRGRRATVLRATFNDEAGTWLYLDSQDGSLVQAEVRGSRAERWLYQGLHSLDVPWLYQRPWVWYPAIIGLSLGGLALSLTSVIVGWTWLRGKVTRAVERLRARRVSA